MNGLFSLSVQLTSKGKRVVRNRTQIRDKKENAYIRKYGKRLYFKIVIPYGQMCDQRWLLTSIVNECGVHFRVFKFHYERNSVVFFVDNFPIARLLFQASEKIQGEHQHKLIIKVIPCHLSYRQTKHMTYMDTTELSRLTPPKCLDQSVDHLQNCLQKRYNQTSQSLDLRNLASDPALLSANISVSFVNLSVMEIIMQIIAHDFPQLTCLNLSHNWLSRLSCFAHLFYATPNLKILDLSCNCLYKAEDLDVIRNLELIELYLQGNPLYNNEGNFSILCRLITYYFPTLQKLDGRFVTQSFFLEPEEPHLLPPCKGSYFLNDHIKSFIGEFLPKFFKVYDSGVRQDLLPLYQEHCCFSLTVQPVLCQQPWFEQIMDYCKENRNLRKVKKAGLRQYLIKYNRLQVVGFLCNLPETEHDLQSLSVDVSFQTASVICCSIQGRFREVQKKKNLVITFRRTFVIVPAADFGAQIMNDQMFISDLFLHLPEVVLQKQFTSKLSCEDLAIVARKQSDLSLCDDPVTIVHKHSRLKLCEDPVTIEHNTVLYFAKCTGMKPDWAQKCLNDNKWDIEKSLEVFQLLKAQGTIPAEAFLNEEPQSVAYV